MSATSRACRRGRYEESAVVEFRLYAGSRLAADAARVVDGGAGGHYVQGGRGATGPVADPVAHRAVHGRRPPVDRRRAAAAAAARTTDEGAESGRRDAGENHTPSRRGRRRRRRRLAHRQARRLAALSPTHNHHPSPDTAQI